MKVPTSAFTFKTIIKTLCYLGICHGKYKKNWDTDKTIIKDRQL